MSGGRRNVAFRDLVSLLLPPPRLAQANGHAFKRRRRWRIGAVQSAAKAAAERLRAGLAESGSGSVVVAAGDDADVHLGLEPGRRPPEGYGLAVREEGISIVAPDPAGLFHGTGTLLQWLALHPPEAGDRGEAITGIEVDDHPDFAARGFLIDVSRNKVPTLDTLYGLVDLMAHLKLNQLQLYTEHTFAYAGHEAVWEGASPLTGNDLRALDRYAAERHVELVPNQNSFGHFHRWLAHEPYRALAECPDGLEHPFGDAVEPFSLCPTDPRSLELLAGLYDQLLPNFSSRRFNVGFDETFDLGRGRSHDACEERGTAAVYLGFLREVAALAAARGRAIQFWADVALADPEHLPEVPEGATALVWGYEADHPFAEECRALADSGVPFYVCPGTSSWVSFGGRATNALDNLAAAATRGVEAGASGYLVTDWGDLGHLQPLPVSYLGLLAGAAFSWNRAAADAPHQLDWAALLDLHAFHHDGLGAAALEIGNAYLDAGPPIKNGTTLARLLLSPHDDLNHERYEHLEAAGIAAAKARLERARDGLPDAPEDPAAVLETRELAWAAGMLELACRLGEARLEAGREASIPALPRARRRRLARELSRRIAELPGIWLARNRPGGLSDSSDRLGRVLELLAP